MNEQLPLTFPQRGRFSWDRFVVGPNAALVDRLQRPGNGACIWLWGARGVGKTRLLQTLCHDAEGGAYVPAPALRDLGGYEAFERVLIDDVDVWLGDRNAEEALFHLYNQQAARGHLLALAGRRSPATARFALPDLGSRLRGSWCFEMLPLGDGDAAQALQRAAQDRGIDLGDDALRFLRRHASRNLADLLALLDAADRAALAGRSRVTVPLLQRALRDAAQQCARP